MPHYSTQLDHSSIALSSLVLGVCSLLLAVLAAWALVALSQKSTDTGGTSIPLPKGWALVAGVYTAMALAASAMMLLETLTFYSDVPLSLVANARWALAAISAVAVMVVPVAVQRMLSSQVNAELQEEGDRRRAAEQLFDLAFEQSAIGMALVGLDGEWLRVNKALEGMLGYTSSELINGMSFQDITHPDDLDKDLHLLDKLRQGHIRSYTIEKRYERKDGVFIWALLAVSMVRTPTGEPLLHVSQIENIDDRIKQADALLDANKKLAAANKQLGEQNAQLSRAYKQLLDADLTAQAKELADQLEAARLLRDNPGDE